MVKNLTCFAFRGNISQRVLERLSVGSKLYIESDEQFIKQFALEITQLKTSHILGFGQYSGRDTYKLRIETICSNKFRNNIDGVNYYQYKLTPLPYSSDKVKLATGIGNSYCNLVSFQITKSIYAKNSKTKYTFIHIPKTFSLITAVNELASLIHVKI